MSVFEYLSIPEDFHDEYDSWCIEYEANYPADGGQPYEYYFYVPEEASDEMLEAMKWVRGKCIRIDPSAFHDEELPDPDY